MEWGWNPDTVAAITTALAAIAAAVAGLFAWFAYRAEHDARELAKKAHGLAERQHREAVERERQTSKEKERAQAELVSAWATLGVADDGSDRVEIQLQNLSAAPVYSACLGLVLTASACYAGRVRVIPPSGPTTLVAPAKESANEVWRKWAASYKSHPAPYVEFTFQDASGRWWYRNGYGVLSETTKDEAYRY